MSLLHLIERDTLTALSTDRITQRFGPYLASIHPTDDLRWLSGVVLDSSIPATDTELAHHLPAINHELVGVGTLPQFRRRGLAATASSATIAHHFAQKHPHVGLSASDSAALRTYTKIGFTPIGTQLNYTDPTPPPQ